MIQARHLEIKMWTDADTAAFFELSQDDGFNLFPITIYRQPNLEAARIWVRNAIALHGETKLGKWGVWEKGSGLLIGLGGLTPWQFENEKMVDITYRLRESAWGKGYGSELAFAMARHAFGVLGLSEITATITPDNLASIKLAKKLGMKFDRRIILRGVETDLFRLGRRDFRE